MLKLAMGSALLVTATQVVAVSLGATQGSVIIGRPLDLLVQSSIDSSEAAAGLCLEAEVMYGDMRVPPTAITVAVHRAGTDGTGALRVRTTEPVNEPFVTLTLKAGCQTPFRRSYTLLADMEPRVATSSSVPVLPVPVQRPSTLAPARPNGQTVTASAAVPKAAETVSPEPETPIRLSAPAPRPAAVTRMLSKTRPLPVVVPGPTQDTPQQAAGTVTLPQDLPTGGSRLQLDPVELPAASTGMPSAASAAQAGVAGATEGPTPAPAPAESVSSADAAPQPNPLQQEVEALRAEQERLRLALETMNAQLRAAEQAQGPSPLVYGLGGLSLLLLGGLWYALRTRRQLAGAPSVSVPWWESSLPQTAEPAQVGGAPSADVPALTANPGGGATADDATANRRSAQSPAQSDRPSTGAETTWLPTGTMDGLEVADARESMFHEVPVTPLDLGALEDTWQRVRFCESIGQTQDAMAALSTFVTDNPRASEAPYLLWLQLASVHGSEADRATAQRFYETHFQRLAPKVGDLTANRHLDEDPVLVQAIVRAWPSSAAHDVLARALASQPGAADNPLAVRTLAAFDDLLMLKGLLEARESCTDTPLQDAGSEVPGWKSVTELEPRPAAVMPSSAPMLDFELPFTPPSAGTEKTTSAAKPVQADDNSLDFDFGMFELEPKSQPQEKPDGDRKP